MFFEKNVQKKGKCFFFLKNKNIFLEKKVSAKLPHGTKDLSKFSKKRIVEQFLEALLKNIFFFWGGGGAQGEVGQELY